MADTIDFNIFDRKDYEPYFRNLGKFLHEFSLLEYWLLETVRKLANVNWKIEAAVFPGLRADVARDTINRLFDATGNIEAKARIKPLFDQLGLINAMRNHILHWGMWSNGGPHFVVTNRHVAASPDRLQSYLLKPSTLDDLAVDTIRINVLLWPAIWPKRRPHLEKENKELLATLWKQPWRYKPTPLGAQSSPPRNTPRSPKRPPSASDQKP